MDDLYTRRLENIKEKLGNEPMTFDSIMEIDPEFANAYRYFLEPSNQSSLMNQNRHNEVLVSNPQIIAIFTDNINNLPEEYLIKSQAENLPIVVVKYK